jgi:starch synthase (maltosyl-transferring)
MKMEDGKKRVVIEAVSPEIDGGRFPIKRTVGEKVVVEADVFADGHDVLSCRLMYRKEEESAWTHAPMNLLGNDRWRGALLAAVKRGPILANVESKGGRELY